MNVILAALLGMALVAVIALAWEATTLRGSLKVEQVRVTDLLDRLSVMRNPAELAVLRAPQFDGAEAAEYLFDPTGLMAIEVDSE